MQNQTSNVSCTNTVFGSDPLPGQLKYCFVKPSVVSALSQEESLLLSVYPNPSLDGVFHLSNIYNYEVFDAQGHLVVSSKREIVDLSSYPSGVYVLKIGSTNTKLIR